MSLAAHGGRSSRIPGWIRQQARHALAGLKTDLGLNVAAAPPAGANRHVEATPPAEINNFYSEYGPPVITYYAPPWPYYDMYAWATTLAHKRSFACRHPLFSRVLSGVIFAQKRT